MQFYLCLYFVSVFFFLCGFDKRISIIANKISLFIFCVFLICLAGFRYGISTDYWSYHRIFVGTDKGHIEPGWHFLINLYKSIFGENFNGYIFYIALISCGIKFLYLNNFKYPFAGIAVFIPLFYDMTEYNALRQGLAVSFLFIGVEFAIRKKLLIYLIFIFIASMIHISSLLFLPVYYFINKVNKIKISALLTLVIVIFVFKVIFFEVWFQLLVSLLKIIKQPVLSDFMYKAHVFITHDTTGALIRVGFLRRVVILLLFILLNNNKKYIENKYFNIYFIGTLIYLLFMGNNVMESRMSLSFEAFLIPAFASLEIQPKLRNMYCLGAILFLFMLLYISVMRSGPIKPYQTYLFYEQ